MNIFDQSASPKPTSCEIALSPQVTALVSPLAPSCPGYRYNAEEQTWGADEVFPKWKAKYPEPPDVLGVTRVYEKHIDMPIMAAIKVRVLPSADLWDGM